MKHPKAIWKDGGAGAMDALDRTARRWVTVAAGLKGGVFAYAALVDPAWRPWLGAWLVAVLLDRWALWTLWGRCRRGR